MIRDLPLEEIRERLVELLPQMIRPEKTVGEIMSRGPQLLDPQVTVAQAAEQMQRFGHEGYPVVEAGEVVGLLTRRAVDRALAHELHDVPISRVMDAGNLTVKPEDSVQHLQRVMMERHWGQVPVVDPEGGDILGIVTRTDLLKTLVRAEPPPETDRLVDRLEAALEGPRLRLLKLVAQEAEAQQAALYIVGGFVRDLLLEQPSVDYDLVVEGDAIALARALSRRYGGRVHSHRRFGTAKWRLDLEGPSLCQALELEEEEAGAVPGSLDLVSARTEFYTHPTALPSVQRGSIKLDLHRRDFSINTLALRLDGRHYGELLDHWGGRRDVREGRIRVLHSLSFVDDPTRMLRAVRLEQRLGFHIEPRTLELLHEAEPLLDRVSGERIRSELELMFGEEALVQIMRRLHELGLLQAIHPLLDWDERVERHFETIPSFRPHSDWRLTASPERRLLCYGAWLIGLSAEGARQVCDRLHFSASARKSILEAQSVGETLPPGCAGLTPSQTVAHLDSAGEKALAISWLALDEQPKCREIISRYLSTWRFVSPLATGDTLRDLGLTPGPVYGEIIERLRAAWLDGEVRTAQEERALLARLVEQARAKA
jgi:tRNA nucleotidyltransferase (CCA-adding enzyme)